MRAKADDSVTQIIVLSRRLCACDDLLKQHRDYMGNLRELAAPTEVKACLGVDQLTLWTLCSRESASSVFRRNDGGHIVVDGFQFLALSKILTSVVFSAGPAAATVTFLSLIAEAFLRQDCLELAYACKQESLNIFNHTVEAHVVTASADHVLYAHYIQKLFVLSHELSHLIFDSPDTTISSRLKKDIDIRLKDVRKLMRVNGFEELNKQIDDGRWSLIGEDMGFREELCCDTLALEQLGHLLGKAGGMNRSMICEAIIVASVSLDILRLLRSIAEESQLSLDSLSETLLNRHFVRTVHLAHALSYKFGVSSGQLIECWQRFQWAFSGKGGLLSLLSYVQELRRWPQLAGLREEANSRIEDMCSWRSDQSAILCDRVFPEQ